MYKSIAAVAALLLTASAMPAAAGPYADALGRCLIENTSENDRKQLIVWMFSAASQHPVVRDLLVVTPQQVDTANKAMADLTMRLLTEECLDVARKAIRIEGKVTLEQSFNLLGQVAGRELFSSPHVAEAMAGYAGHLDGQKLQQLMQ